MVGSERSTTLPFCMCAGRPASAYTKQYTQRQHVVHFHLKSKKRTMIKHGRKIIKPHTKTATKKDEEDTPNRWRFDGAIVPMRMDFAATA